MLRTCINMNSGKRNGCKLELMIDRCATISYHRRPTQDEIDLVQGCKYYKDLPLFVCLKTDGSIKKWVKCPLDGLRYYYQSTASFPLKGDYHE